MRSEEEEEVNGDDNVNRFRRRRQMWKSNKFCRFTDKLDQRLSKRKSSKSNPAHERCYGKKLEVVAPAAAKSWMKTQQTETLTEPTTVVTEPTNVLTESTGQVDDIVNSDVELSDSESDEYLD